MSVRKQRQGIVNAAASVYAELAVTANSTTYVQLTASTSVPILITHIFRFITPTYNGGATIGDLTIGIGSGGAETAIIAANTGGLGAAGSGSTAGATSNTVYALPFPIRVPAATRIAAKLSMTDTSSTIGIIYVNESAVI